MRGTTVSGSTTSRRTFVPAGPLMRAVATSLDTPAIERPFTAVMKSPCLMPPSFAGEPSNTLQHPQAAAVLVDVHPDALELALHRLLELLGLLRA